MEFKEYSNPEERDYDITSSISYNEPEQERDKTNKVDYSIELINLIGILEDFEEEDLINQYGITMKEYLQPTKETLIKVKKALISNKKKEHHR